MNPCYHGDHGTDNNLSVCQAHYSPTDPSTDNTDPPVWIIGSLRLEHGASNGKVEETIPIEVTH